MKSIDNSAKKYITLFAIIACFIFKILPVHAYHPVQSTDATFNLPVAYMITTMISFVLLLGYLAFVKKREIIFIFLYSAVFIINIGYAFLAASSTLPEALLANKISYLGAVFLPLIMFMIITMESRIKLPRFIILGMILISTFVFFLAASPGYSTVYYKSAELVISPSGSYLIKDYGPMHIVYYAYLFLYFLSMIVAILYSYYVKKNKSLKLVLHLLTCVSCNILIWYLGQVFHFRFEFLSVSYIVTETYLLSIYNMIEDFHDIEYSATEHSMVTMVVDSKEDHKLSSMYDSDSTLNIDEIIHYWPQVAQLTPREIEVFKLLIQNKKRKDIADELCVSENTVKKHTSNIFSKLNISNRTEIIKIISEIR